MKPGNLVYYSSEPTNDLKHLRDQYGLLLKYTDISSFQGGGGKEAYRVWTVLYGDKTYVIYEGDLSLVKSKQL